MNRQTIRNTIAHVLNKHFDTVNYSPTTYDMIAEYFTHE